MFDSGAGAEVAALAVSNPMSPMLAVKNSQRAPVVDPVTATSVAKKASGKADELPEGWDELIDEESGYPYWLNTADGSATWERPTAPAAAPSGELPPGWREVVDEESGCPYFFHDNGSTSWERPPGASGTSRSQQL